MQLPELPLGAVATPRPIGYGGDLTPGLGGPVQRIIRLGSRYAIDVELPALDPACARRWIAALARCERETALLRFPQPDLAIGDAGGAVAVSGAGQAGSRLALHRMAPGYAVREGQFLHIVANGRHHLHQVTAAAVVDGFGRAVLDLWPMLRISPPADAPVSFNPVIEGLIPARGTPWTVPGSRVVTGLAFTLTEDQ